MIKANIIKQIFIFVLFFLLQEYFYPKYLGELELSLALCGSAAIWCLTLELVTAEVSAKESDGNLIAINMI